MSATHVKVHTLPCKTSAASFDCYLLHAIGMHGNMMVQCVRHTFVFISIIYCDYTLMRCTCLSYTLPVKVCHVKAHATTCKTIAASQIVRDTFSLSYIHGITHEIVQSNAASYTLSGITCRAKMRTTRCKTRVFIYCTRIRVAKRCVIHTLL